MAAIKSAPHSLDPAADPEIAAIRAEIARLTSRTASLKSALLASQPTRNLLEQHISNPKTKPTSETRTLQTLLSNAAETADLNLHRLAFSTTAFTFNDASPSPASSAKSKKLLGVRIDTISRDGWPQKPYYVFLRREVNKDANSGIILRVHRHTLPSFIPVKPLAHKYLPTPTASSAAEAELKPWKAKKTDLQSFVRELRNEVAGWQMRVQGVVMLRAEFGIVGDETDTSRPGVAKGSVEQIAVDITNDVPTEDPGRIVESITATSMEARYIRVAWIDGVVGRLRISDRGVVDRAVVFGDRGRERAVEIEIVRGNVKIEDLGQRLVDVRRDLEAEQQVEEERDEDEEESVGEVDEGEDAEVDEDDEEDNEGEEEEA